MSCDITTIDARSVPVESHGTIREAAAKMFGCSPDRVFDLCRNFWPQTKDTPPLTNAECWTGLTLAVKYGLDPAAREIYVMRTRDKIACAIGIDGWIKILDATDGYDGFEQHLEFDGDSLIYVETTIYSTRRSHPTKYRAYQREYGEMGGFVAKKMPWHMLRIFSLRHAARLFAPIGGNVVTEEEAKWLQAYSPDDEAPKTQSLKQKVSKAAFAMQAPEPEPPFNPPTAAEVEHHREPGDDDELEPSSPQARRLAALAKCRSLQEIRGWWKSFEDESNAGMISQAEQIALVNAELALKAKIEGRLP